MVWLVFSFGLIQCRQKETNSSQSQEVVIRSDEKGSNSLTIPRSLLKQVSDKTIKESLKIFLKGKSIPVIGEIQITEAEVVFTPVIRFTPGYTYDVKIKDETLTSVRIEEKRSMAPTVVTHIYPSVDTLPENLLKFYIAFSQSMQEGYALENIVLIRNEKDTLKEVFMEIQPELWDREKKMLTLWLDPGRIKRDLQPNQRLGNPLETGNRYRLLIRQSFRDAYGKDLAQPFSKEFIVGPRDSTVPIYKDWKLALPKAGAREPLIVTMKECMDYGVLIRAIHIHNSNHDFLDGIIEPRENETVFHFIPDKEWAKGDYTVELQARLEDLAGNNLERLFDKDLEKQSGYKSREQFQVRFTVQ